MCACRAAVSAVPILELFVRVSLAVWYAAKFGMTSHATLTGLSGTFQAGVRGNLFPNEFVRRELFPGYNCFRAREFVPHLGNSFPLYLPCRASRYFVLHARYTVLASPNTLTLYCIDTFSFKKIKIMIFS